MEEITFQAESQMMFTLHPFFSQNYIAKSKSISHRQPTYLQVTFREGQRSSDVYFPGFIQLMET